MCAGPLESLDVIVRIIGSPDLSFLGSETKLQRVDVALHCRLRWRIPAATDEELGRPTVPRAMELASEGCRPDRTHKIRVDVVSFMGCKVGHKVVTFATEFLNKIKDVSATQIADVLAISFGPNISPLHLAKLYKEVVR